MTNMRIGARKRQEIRRVNETARRRMAVLLPEAEEPPDTEPSVYTAPPSAAAIGSVGAPPGPPGGGPQGVLDLGEPDVGAPGDGTPGDGSPGDAAQPGPPGSAPMLDRRAAVGLLILLLLAVGYGIQHFWLARPQPVEVPAVAVASVSSAATPGTVLPEDRSGTAGGDGGVGAPAAVVVVDIGGRVSTPGVHTLPNGSRVADALRVAGGPLPGTDTRNLNLARVLADGEQILVGEPNPQPAAGAGPGPPPAGPSKQPVSLNHATLEQLDTLPGVGPTLAQRIIAFRASHGGAFRSLDQLRQVSGVGERTYAELRPLLTL
ncbi:helix-hairpin-helix domain-containing protein [Kitasatospora misakiensis]|uniref:Helix-hairpin-helix domain-containing protein n=1 Tax=Kitasatospora misakiensis TaxID=67330 RepID=A0ABW0X0C6_9ACTN